METHENEMLRRVVLGLLLVIGGYLFVYPLQFLSFFSGLWLMGLAVGPREMDAAAPAPKARMEEAPKPVKEAPAKASAPKKRKRKSS